MNKTLSLDADGGVDISIPLNFNGIQPNAYGVLPASSTACESGTLVGDTRQGGSCNFEQYTFIPHCSGTHTECVGHITRERISVRDCLRDIFIRAALVSVTPEEAFECGEIYPVEYCRSDVIITRRILETALSAFDALDGPAPRMPIPGSYVGPASTALIIRTLPNDESKLSRKYDDPVPPYLSTEAMQFIVDRGFRHLLVDLPSVDRLYDDGKLSNHRLFWNVEPGGFELNAETRVNSTVTELIYVPEDAIDGEYLLNLQIAPFAADASPSRPVIFKIA
ncbi:MAG: cyclase family protein [Acidobacteriota bacterium]